MAGGPRADREELEGKVRPALPRQGDGGLRLPKGKHDGQRGLASKGKVKGT
jgi:hypothetical protein